MGIYLNPKKEMEEYGELGKLKWLEDNGHVVSFNVTPMIPPPENECYVCVIDNGFLAAGVVYNKDEFIAFTDPNDPRTKLWFTVPIKKIQEQESYMKDSYFEPFNPMDYR